MIYTSHDSAGFIKVLSFLKSHNSEYLSGQDVSDLLKISRVAVWKHIKKIRALGYKIESKQKLGYRLIKDTTLPLPWEITDNLKTKLIGKKTYYFDSIDSTQNFAQRLASDHNENGSVVVARKQITGRGRHKRRWLSPQGGIWLSVILQPSFDISVATVFPLAVGLALANTIEQSYKIKPSLKWPNDVTIDGKKVAGILIDASIEATKIEYLVLGVGINFQINAKDIEKKIRNTPNFCGVTTLVNEKTPVSPAPFIRKFLEALEFWVKALEAHKADLVIAEWTKRSSTIGKFVDVFTSTGMMHGKAIKLDNDGALLLKSRGKMHKILEGDVLQKVK